MSHTPGPWTFRRNFARTGEYEIYSGEQPIAIVLNRADGVHDEEIAILIAAAPDLLEALRAMVEIAELTIGWIPAPPEADGPLIKARAAIAKAIGG